MEPEYENLDILFRLTRPESALNNYYHKYSLKDNNKMPLVCSECYEVELYKQYSNVSTPYLTLDEMQLRAEWMQKKLCDYKSNNHIIFGFLCDYADQMLRIVGNEPVCKLNNIQEWNKASLAIDQDLLVTAWLADKDTSMSRDLGKKYSYTWKSVLHTDDAVLNHIIQKGLAENHFHLKGSPQIFPLTWIYIMNHPDRISKILKTYDGFKNNLRPNIIWSSSDIIMSWTERLIYAAYIRAILFKRIISGKDEMINIDDQLQINDNRNDDDQNQDSGNQNNINDEADTGDSNNCNNDEVNNKKNSYYKMNDSILPVFIKITDIINDVSGLRCLVGDRFRQINNKKKCLDYAISSLFYSVDAEHPFRVLTGERFLMYSCFAAQFRGELSKEYSDLLYIYILLKTSFRGELIQSNERPGFDNFALYQDRKDKFFENIPEYETESIRTAIRGQMEESNIKSLEARIMPAKSKKAMNSKVDLLDKQVRFSYQSNKIDLFSDTEDVKDYKDRYFYVVHFPKLRYSLKECGDSDLLIKPRNYKCRAITKTKAMALKAFLNKSKNDYRVHGIDACANEIGCRPEVFATEFRYLRGEEGIQVKGFWAESTEKESGVRVTYHVGEDFTDIADGLRAVDEAIRFLGLQKGDRIGHGLVLGVDPIEYYNEKHRGYTVYKQDYLDNLLWVLDKISEYNISIETSMYNTLKGLTKELFDYIYGGSLYMFFDPQKRYGIEQYYDMYWDSWNLRGDHPVLYKSGRYEATNLHTNTGYERFMKVDDRLDVYRSNPIIGKLLFLYHYDKGVKERGAELVNVKVDERYIILLEEIMHAFRNTISELGLAIESNPTSNLLIGSFHSYESHPLFEFKPTGIDENKHDILVSLNTDDLGVFNTSLANEYALIYDSLHNKMNNSFGEMDIVNYMNQLRENGFLMSFS